MQKLFDYAWIFNLRVNILDGDTPQSVRKQILMNPPDILLTNFDMIHYHIGKRTPLGSLFPKARIVIIDELHEYSGAFGTHVHYIIKRLKRSAKRLGAVQFIMSSATINNPEEHCGEETIKMLKDNGATKAMVNTVLSHYEKTEIVRDDIIKKALAACDELTGFIVACSLVRPTKMIGMKAKSVTKKLKDKSFAAQVNRDDMKLCEEYFNIPVSEFITILIPAIADIAEEWELT